MFGDEMHLIIEYLVNMSKYMIMVIPLYVLIRFIMLSKSNKKINWYHEIFLFIFVLFITGLASQTILPKFEFGVNGFRIVANRIHETNLIPFKVLKETYNEVFINNNFNYFLINFLGNIIMFIPIGFLIPLLWNTSFKKVIIIGLCSSLFIELVQLFLARGTDIDDVFLNTLGVFLGLLIYTLLYKKYQVFLNKFK